MKTQHKVRVAAAQLNIEELRDWTDYENKLSRWVAEAAAAGARILVFPEYGGMELSLFADRRSGQERRSPERHQSGPLPVSGADRRAEASLAWATDQIQSLVPQYLSLHADLAKRHRIYLLAGSLPLKHSGHVITNTAFMFSPNGFMGSQDKLILTRWEREVWQMTGGREVRVFDTDFGPIGIDICYDVEFPIVARRQAEAGARIILAPCCCDSMRGYYRVRVGARARALENQMYVIQSAMSGDGTWSPTIGRTVGLSSIYSPPDLGPFENGVIAQGSRGIAQWVYADLDLTAIDRIRGSQNTIANAEEWAAHIRIGPAVRADFKRVA